MRHPQLAVGQNTSSGRLATLLRSDNAKAEAVRQPRAGQAPPARRTLPTQRCDQENGMTQELIEAADELLTMLTRNEDTGWTARDKDVDRLELALELAKVEAPQATRTKPEPTKAAEQDYIEGWNDALSAFIAAFSKLAKRA